MAPLERYLEVVLRLRQIAPDLVDYVGAEPSGPAPDPKALRDDAAALRAELNHDRWIAGQLRGIEVACELLAGAHIPYRELVERCYGLTPEEVPEERFAAAHERLDAALPGTAGTVHERYARWLQTQLVPAERVLPAVHVLTAELGARARERFGLPEGEGVEVTVVHDEPWFAYARYEGDLHSSIQINADLPIHGFDLLDLVAHEIYPGHHTEHILKEEHFAAFAYPTPQALISEGIAMLAQEQLLGEEAHEVGAACLQPLGIGYDVGVATEVDAAQLALRAVRSNLAMRLDEGRLDVEGALAYARRWLPDPDPYAEKVVQRLRSERWTPYESCYPEGLAVCRAFCERDPDGYRRLLTEPLTTEDVLDRTIR